MIKLILRLTKGLAYPYICIIKILQLLLNGGSTKHRAFMLGCFKPLLASNCMISWLLSNGLGSRVLGFWGVGFKD